ncbi:MAG: hypothetical protein ABFD86_01130 [Bryobacteraceae bacterium]
MRRPLLIAVPILILATGCGRYEDFTLPAPVGAPTGTTFSAEAFAWPVLGRGATGEWDGVDTLNPAIVMRGGTYYNFYSGFDGKTWHTGLATSADGLEWTRRGKVLSPKPETWEGDYIAANGTALLSGGMFLYWYQAGGRRPSIGFATSADGTHWTREPLPVLQPGPRGSWDERGVADPCVIWKKDAFYMYYLGQDRAGRQRLGVARSTGGKRWEKLRSNPVMELGPEGAFDENGLGEPAVWTEYGWYWMLYTGRDRAENRRLGLARSRDGVHWHRASDKAVFEGGQSWNSKVVCDPSVLVDGGIVRVWFGGGDAASPDEHLNGQIGLAILRPVGANLSK